MKHLGLTVLESRWWEGTNTSVRGTFDLLSDLYCNNHHAYNYEMCNSSAALREAVRRYVCADTNTSYISIASHGSEEGLHLFNEERVSRAELRNDLKRDVTNRSVVGLHFGSCSFGTQELAEFLFAGDISPWWIAGYRSKVGFLESTVLDLLFFQELIRNRSKDPIRQMHAASRALKKAAPGLIDELEFGVYYLADGPNDKVVNLLA